MCFFADLQTSFSNINIVAIIVEQKKYLPQKKPLHCCSGFFVCCL
jgi:hypothetical protein